MPQLSIAENIFAGRQPTRWLGPGRRARDARAGGGADRAARRRHRPGAEVVGRSRRRRRRSSRSPRRCRSDLQAPDPRRADRGADADRDRRASSTSCGALARDGVSVIYVSHRLAEIFALCDRVTVLKDGRLAGTRDVAETDDRRADPADGRARRASGARAGRAHARRRWCSRPRASRRAPFVRSASLTVRAGEIVCLAGLVGSGRSEILRDDLRRAAPRPPARSGSTGARCAPPGPWDGMAAGIGMVPEDRKDGRAVPRHGRRRQHLGDGAAQGVVLGAMSPTARPRRWPSASSASCASRRRASGAGRRQSFRRQPAEGAAGQMAGDWSRRC